jgi:hypothetical protein
MLFEIIEKHAPKNGDVRDITRFAWFPTKVRQLGTGKQFIVWFGKYNVCQKFDRGGTWTDNYAE